MPNRKRNSLRFGISAAAVTLLLAATPAFAQSKDKAAKAAAVQPAESGLQARVQSLEEQLVDMQVVVGTLETLAKSGGSAPAPFPASTAGGDGDAARIEGLETQIRALTAQVQQLSDQVRSLGGTPRRSDIAPPSDAALADNGTYPQAHPAAVASPGFGSTTVAAGDDAIGGLLNSDGAHPAAAATGGEGQPGADAPPPAPVATAALAPASESSNDPKQLYETAYGYLLQRDYGAAETAFDEFLKKFPSDSLSGNAQYWLGETHFVRGQYKAAASAFLKGYQSYAQSAKAPDSLLKLAMSLDRLGQKDAACSSFAELAVKFPTAPKSVKARAQSERQRVGCQ